MEKRTLRKSKSGSESIAEPLQESEQNDGAMNQVVDAKVQELLEQVTAANDKARNGKTAVEESEGEALETEMDETFSAIETTAELLKMYTKVGKRTETGAGDEAKNPETLQKMKNDTFDLMECNSKLKDKIERLENDIVVRKTEAEASVAHHSRVLKETLKRNREEKDGELKARKESLKTELDGLRREMQREKKRKEKFRKMTEHHGIQYEKLHVSLGKERATMVINPDPTKKDKKMMQKDAPCVVEGDAGDEILWKPPFGDWYEEMAHVFGINKARVAAKDSQYGKTFSVYEEPKEHNMVNSADDGHCWYHTISRVIANDENYHWEIRRVVSEFIERNAETLREFYPRPIFENYTKARMNKRLPGVWAEYVDVFGTACVMGTAIYVFVYPEDRTKNIVDKWICISPPAYLKKYEHALYVRNTGGFHFEMVMMM